MSTEHLVDVQGRTCILIAVDAELMLHRSCMKYNHGTRCMYALRAQQNRHVHDATSVTWHASPEPWPSTLA